MKARWKMFKGLDTQMIAFFLVATLLFSAIASSFYYERTFSMLKTGSEQYHIQSMQQSQRWISQTLDEIDRITRVLSYSDAGQSVLAHAEQDSETTLLYHDFLKSIHEILVIYPFIHSIYFYSSDGVQIGENGTHSCVSADSPSYAFIQSEVGSSKSWNIIGGLREDFFNPLFNKMEDNPRLITMAKQEMVIQSTFVYGYIVVNIEEETLCNHYRTELPDESLFMINADRQIISSGDKDSIGQIYGNEEGLDFSEVCSSVIDSDGGVLNLNLSYRIPNTELCLVNHIRLNDLAASSRQIIWTISLTMCIGSLCLLLIVSVWLRWKLRPLKELVTKMSDIQSGRLGSTFRKIPRNEFGVLIQKFNEMSLSISELLRKNDQINQEKTEQELMALRAQLNPHFIYNTLNMIKWMAVMRGAGNIADCITTLGCLLEPIFKSRGDFWEVRSEIDYLQNYIKIMGWRYGNMCTFACSIPPECQTCRIPRYIFQPITENSVTHGIPREKAIHILVSGEKRDGRLILSVRDNGSSIPPEKLAELREMLQNNTPPPNASVGLYNVNRRIKLNFGDEYGLTIESELGIGTTVRLTLPVLQDPKNGAPPCVSESEKDR